MSVCVDKSTDNILLAEQATHSGVQVSTTSPKNDDFLLKNDDFLLKNDGFMFKNDDFLLKNDDQMGGYLVRTR